MKIGLTRSNRTLAGAFGLLLALALVLGLVAPVLAVPGIPMQRYGDVTIDGLPAPVLTEVRAEIDGVVYATTTVDANGQYGMAPNFVIPADDPDTPAKEGGVAGVDDVDLFVGGTLATTVAFEAGSVRLDLALGAPDEYTLTTASTDCGNVTDPGEGDFIYAVAAMA